MRFTGWSALLLLPALAGCFRGATEEPSDTADLRAAPAQEMGVACFGGSEFGCGSGLVCDPCSQRCVPPASACAADAGMDLVWERPGCRPEPGLGACYSFEEDGDQVLDGSGNGNHGVLEGGGWQRMPGKFGGGLAFSGQDGRVHVPASPTLDFLTGSTVEFWLKVAYNPTDTGTVGEVASRGTGDNDNTVAFWSTCGNACGVWQHGADGVSSVCSFCSAIR